MSFKSSKNAPAPHDQEIQPAQTSEPSIAPGKRTRTTSLPPGPAGVSTQVQRSPNLAGNLAAKPVAQAAPAGTSELTTRWLDTAARPDLCPPPVQMQGSGAPADANVHSLAAQGLSGSPAALPHLTRIQQSFGHHDVSEVEAHVGGPAAQASQAMGASAYATGNHVAFGAAPDLHTAAHEAAHVVQQRAGVQLAGGVGQVGDAYEQHADAIADSVVAGRSAEGLLDAFAPAAAAGDATQRKAVQRVASDYKSDTDIKAMTLRAFDRYAHAQADWATSGTLGADKEKLRALLAFARKDNGLVLGACGDFTVDELWLNAVGQGSLVDGRLVAYSRAASPDRNAGTIHIETTAAAVDAAVDWGKAILKLEADIGGLIIERVIPQNATYQGLKRLVDANAVDDLVAYYKAVQPLLDAENGMEILSYLEFRNEGGQGKYANYKTALPEIRNYHRFTVQQLDLLITNKTAAQTNPAQTPPLPVCVVLQTAFDHNGAFHRDPYMTAVISRVTHITLVAEGKGSLGAFSSDLAAFAAYGKDGKVDEVMVSGHGNAQVMELGGDKGVGQNGRGDTIYGTSSNEPLTVNPRAPLSRRQDTDTFIQSIIDVLRDDPGSRVVLNACLTASNSVTVALDPDPDKAAQQVKDAIAADPSLATAMQTKLGTHQGQVRGANASFGQVGLLDGGGNIDIVSGGDPKLTAPKIEYAEEGTEPTGVLRATLESWANDKQGTIDALNRRLIATSGDTSWRETVIRALIKIIVANPNDGGLINTFATSADALGHLAARAHCRVSALKGQVPDAHVDAIFTDLMASDIWSDASFDYVPAVVYQVWIEKNNGKVGDFLAFLNASSFNTLNAARVLDLTHLQPLLGALLPAPVPPDKPPRGPFLIALLYIVAQETGAPAACKDYIKTVVGNGQQVFPVGCNVADILKGASEQSVLEDAGIVQKANAVPLGVGPVGPTPNVAPTGAGNNTIAVESVTMQCKTHGLTATDAYMLPAGTKVGTIASGTTLHVIGKTKGTSKGTFWNSTNVDFYAVEHTIGSNKTVFVQAGDVKLV